MEYGIETAEDWNTNAEPNQAFVHGVVYPLDQHIRGAWFPRFPRWPWDANPPLRDKVTSAQNYIVGPRVPGPELIASIPGGSSNAATDTVEEW